MPRLSLISLLLFLCLGASQAQIQSNKRLRDSILIEKEEEPVDSVVRHYLELKDITIRTGNSIRLFKDGTEKFDALLPELENATHHIHMEYFNFRNDSISHRVFEILTRKARAGVQVRVLFDAFGNLSNNKPLKNRQLDSLRDQGIEIVKFDPIRFPWINHAKTRDHRKLVVIDARVAYLGGMNIADYYIQGLEKIGSWRDMHCRIEGDAVGDVQRIFAYMWQKATEIELLGSAFFPERSTKPGSVSLAVTDRSPKIQPDAIKDAYALSIAGADSIVNIVNPYFVPTKAIMSSINKALKKGVEVNIMVSEKSDIPFTPEAMLHKLNKLSKRGAKVHLFQGGFHHAKVMTVDGKLSTLGSANLNSRSLRYDYETNIFIFDKHVTAQLDSIYTADKESSIPLDRAYWKKRSAWKKFVGWFANIFTPFL